MSLPVDALPRNSVPGLASSGRSPCHFGWLFDNSRRDGHVPRGASSHDEPLTLMTNINERSVAPEQASTSSFMRGDRFDRSSDRSRLVKRKWPQETCGNGTTLPLVGQPPTLSASDPCQANSSRLDGSVLGTKVHLGVPPRAELPVRLRPSKAHPSTLEFCQASGLPKGNKES
jgi:hypothetical protein